MSRGKELKGQTLVIPGSRSGASTIVTELAYDSAFNLEFIGEARYGSAFTDLYWYIEKLSYDAAFNLTRIQTAQNQRILGTTGVLTPTANTNEFTFPTGSPTFDIRRNDTINELNVVSISGNTIVLSGTPPDLNLSTLTLTLDEYSTKDFSKRAWDLRPLYIYA